MNVHMGYVRDEWRQTRLEGRCAASYATGLLYSYVRGVWDLRFQDYDLENTPSWKIGEDCECEFKIRDETNKTL